MTKIIGWWLSTQPVQKVLGALWGPIPGVICKLPAANDSVYSA